MSIVVFDYKKAAPTSFHLKQKEVMAIKPGTDELKFIGYYKGQKSIFTEEVLEKNKDLKPSVVPDFVLNPTRNKCELRFDDADKALLNYMKTHPDYNKRYEMYSEEIESEKLLSKTESIEKALDYVRESDELKIRALGLAVLGLSSYNKAPSIIKAQLKEKAINKPKEVITACEDDLYENKFIASLALCSGIVKTNNTMTAIVWADNNGRLLNIATGEDFITKFAKHISEKSPESQSLLQEIGKRLDLTKKEKSAKTKEAQRIADLEAKLAQMQEDLEISQSKEAKKEVDEEELTLEKLAIVELREKYKEVIGKNAPFTHNNNIEWMQQKIDEKEEK